jgi:hypothetical protein
MTGDYILYNLIACLGIIQAGVSYAGIKGLCFFKRPIYAYIFALVAVSVSSAWFFTIKDRNIKGLEGTEQFTFVITATGSALAATLVLSSLINWRMKSKNPPISEDSLGPGFEALKYMTFFQAIKLKFFNKRKQP